MCINTAYGKIAVSNTDNVKDQGYGRTLMKVGRQTLKVALIWLKSAGGMKQLNDLQGFLSSLQL